MKLAQGSNKEYWDENVIDVLNHNVIAYQLTKKKMLSPINILILYIYIYTHTYIYRIFPPHRIMHF